MFVGARLGGSIAGALQWRNPETPDKKFEDFARLVASGAVMAGAGASAKFSVDFVGTQFRIEISAGFCWGLGAKGGQFFLWG